MTESKKGLSTSLSELLLERVPELTGLLEREAAFWGQHGISSLGPDTIFSTVLAPFVIELLKCDDENADDILRRVFALLEELAHSDDDDALSAVDVSFGEELIAETAALNSAKKFMGPRLRATFELMLSRRDSLPERDKFR